MINVNTLYGKDARGALRVWIIYSEDNTIRIEYGTYGGDQIQKSEVIDYGLAGRTRDEQIALRINSRVNKKLDSGYVRNKDDAADNKRVNMMGLDKPMLATRHDKIKNISFFENYVQKKYDGHRCLIKNDSGCLVAYSRNGKPIESIKHIITELESVIPEGTTLDGELYFHGASLQTIGSWVRREQENTGKLGFYCYDAIMEGTYDDRYAFIKCLDFSNLAHSRVVDTDFVFGEFKITPLLKKARSAGYEGLIIRPSDGLYESGKRSKSLIKVKAWFDDEYTVKKIRVGVDGQAILIMEHDGMPFRATAPGQAPEKVFIAENPELFIGKKVNIQYPNLTDKGIPSQPIATMWRDKDEE